MNVLEVFHGRRSETRVPKKVDVAGAHLRGGMVAWLCAGERVIDAGRNGGIVA